MTDKLLETLISNGPLVVALGALYWWATPRLLKATLLNGGGNIVRSIVREENATQTLATHAAVKSALDDHESREFQQYGSLGEGVTLVRERLSALESRISDHLAARPA